LVEEVAAEVEVVVVVVASVEVAVVVVAPVSAGPSPINARKALTPAAHSKVSPTIPPT